MANYNYENLRALKGEEALSDKEYYRDETHVGPEPKELAEGKKDNISMLLAEYIRQKKFGIDVRESIARFIEWMSILFNKTVDSANEAIGKVDKNTEDFKKLNDRYDSQIAGNTNISEVIDARDDSFGVRHQTLKKRLDKIESDALTELASTYFEDIDGGIRDIFNKPISDMKAKLETRKNNINIAQITDSHYTTQDTYWGVDVAIKSITHPLNIGALNDYLDFAIATGDNTDPSQGDKKVAFKYNNDFATVFHSVLKCPTALLKGNHDDGSTYTIGRKGIGYDKILTDADFAKAYQQNGSQGETRNGKSNYFFIDVDGIRIIGLDSYDVIEQVDGDGSIINPREGNSAFSPTQINWFANKALDTNLPILIFTHCPIQGSVGSGHGISANHSIILSILDSFKNGKSGSIQNMSIPGYEVDVSYNFKQTGTIIAVINGHLHWETKQVVNGINFISSQNSFGSSGPTTQANYVRYADSDKEDSWSVFSIDKATRKVDVLRFGRGSDISFNY